MSSFALRIEEGASSPSLSFSRRLLQATDLFLSAASLTASPISRPLSTPSLILSSFGAAFGPFYRLVGPLRGNHEEMSHIVTTELWETVTRRGLAGNFFMGVVRSLPLSLLPLSPRRELS